MSTSESWVVNGHTTRCTGPVSVVLRLRLVSGWGLWNGDQRRPMGLKARERTLLCFLLWLELQQPSRFSAFARQVVCERHQANYVLSVSVVRIAVILSVLVLNQRRGSGDRCDSVSGEPDLTIATVFSMEHRTRHPRSYRRCRTVSLVSYCNSGSLVMHILYWNHYIGFQLPNALTSNWQLWHSRNSPLLNLNTFVSLSPVSTLVHQWQWHYVHPPVLYSRHHAPERHMVVVLLVQLYRPSGTIYQSQSSKRAVCLFFVADSRHICLL